ncbi:MAG: hypothetical protein ACTSUO_08525 [Candidatus Thorarchaeota archaeon]
MKTNKYKAVDEGKVPATTDTETTKIKKLTEEDDEELFSPKEPEKEEEPEVSQPSKKPEKEEEPAKVAKEYIGKTEDTHFYMISVEDDEGGVEDLQIVDQEGVKKYSAKDNNLDPTDVEGFVIKAIQDIEIDEIERSVFLKYILPQLLGEEKPREMPREPREEEGSEEEEITSEEGELPKESRKVDEQESREPMGDIWKLESAKEDEACVALGFHCERALEGDVKEQKFLEKVFGEKWEHIKPKLEAEGSAYYVWWMDGVRNFMRMHESGFETNESKSLLEMKVTDDEGNTFDVYLVDDGTLDTVIEINGREFRFSPEFASLWRDEEGELSEEGLRELALDALSNLEDEEYNALVAGGEEEVEENKIDEQVTPEVGKTYTYTDPKGRSYTGKVTNIAKMRTGAVLAYMDIDGKRKGFPVTKYGVWKEVKTESKSSEGGNMSKVEEKLFTKSFEDLSIGADFMYNGKRCVKYSESEYETGGKRYKISPKTEVEAIEKPRRGKSTESKVNEKAALGGLTVANLKKIKHYLGELESLGFDVEGELYEVEQELAKRGANESSGHAEESRTVETTEGQAIDVYTSAEDETPQKARIVQYERPPKLTTAKLSSGKTVKVKQKKTAKGWRWIIMKESKEDQFILDDELQEEIDDALDEGIQIQETLREDVLDIVKTLSREKLDKFFSQFIVPKFSEEELHEQIADYIFETADDEEIQPMLDYVKKLRSSMESTSTSDEALDEAKKYVPKYKQRGDCVFKSTHPKVKDGKDHFPINSINQARNALARVNQYDSAPSWYDGSLQSLVNAVVRKVHKKYPDIKISKAAKKPGKESKVSNEEHEDIVERKSIKYLRNLLNLS